MTAVIKAIFFTGLLNMKLLAVGVMLKLALIIGKLLYAGKIAFGGEKHGSSYPQFQSFPAVFLHKFKLQYSFLLGLFDEKTLIVFN